MEKVIIYTNENGNVSITFPAPEFLETHIIEDVLAKDCPDHAIIVDDSTLPTDHDFFNAWRLVDGVVSVNLDAAKEIKKEELRFARTPLLQIQDVAFQRALETGADTSSIVAEKQRLRDITKFADAATTLEQLRAISIDE